jgi:hypothetical protein
MSCWPEIGRVSLAALNQLIAAADILDDGRVIIGRPVTVAAAFAAEQPAMAGPIAAVIPIGALGRYERPAPTLVG